MKESYPLLSSILSCPKRSVKRRNGGRKEIKPDKILLLYKHLACCRSELDEGKSINWITEEILILYGNVDIRLIDWDRVYCQSNNDRKSYGICLVFKSWEKMHKANVKLQKEKE